MRLFGKLRYELALVIELLMGAKEPSLANVKLSIRTKESNSFSSFCGSFPLILLQNTKYAGGLNVAPSAMINDGQFDLMFFDDISVFQKLLLFIKLKLGKHRQEKMRHEMVTHLVLQSKDPDNAYETVLTVDGEVVYTQLPMNIEILPGALKICGY